MGAQPGHGFATPQPEPKKSPSDASPASKMTL